MLCVFCNKLCKNNNSKRQHEIRCKKNPNALKVISSFISYNEKLKSGELEKSHSNHFIKAKKLGLDKPIITNSTRKKLSEAGKNNVWDDERRKYHSEVMAKVALENPDVYGNKQKRTIKKYKGINFDSSWELYVAIYFDFNKINWIRPKQPFPYFWKDNWHLYFPDFYLPDQDLYIEVKGYETDRDVAKWSAVKNLLVFKQKEIEIIRTGIPSHS